MDEYEMKSGESLGSYLRDEACVITRGGKVVHPKSIFPVKCLPKLLMSQSGVFGLAEVVANVRRFDLRWACFDRLTLVACEHGVSMVRLGDEDFVSSGGRFEELVRTCLGYDPDLSCCKECVSGYTPWVSGCQVDVGYDEDDDEVSDSPLGSGADCFLRVFPAENHMEAWAKCGPAPRKDVVAGLLEDIVDAERKVVRPVQFVRKGGFLHVEYGGPEGQTYGQLKTVLSGFPSSLCVAGACGNLGYGYLAVPVCASCRARHAALKKILDDVVSKCSCVKQESVPGIWSKSHASPGMNYQALSTVSRGDTVVVTARESMEPIGACPAFRVKPGEVAQVRLHKDVGGCYFNVEGDFVQVWLPPGVAVVMEGGITLEVGPQPVALSAVGRVSARVHGLTGGVLARGRSYAAKVRWMHSVMAEDAADSFARFWVKAGPKIGVFSFGREIQGSFDSVSGCNERNDGVSEKQMIGGLDFRGGSHGTAVAALTGSLRVGRLLIDKGGSLVFGREVSWKGIPLKTVDDTGWKLMVGEDAYYLDDGGPSGSEGFLSEF